jgi:hypothetical protein
MERESAFEDIGYKSGPVEDTRPMLDQGSLNYLVIWPTPMKPAEGMAMARRQLNEMKERDADNPESDPASYEQKQQDAA